MIKSTKNLFALPNKILLVESNPLFALQHAPNVTTFPTQHCEIACVDCKPVLRHTESFSYLVYRKIKL